MTFKTIDWVDGKVVMIDQTLLPVEEIYFECTNFREVCEAIRKMKIRGAPAIGIAGALGVLLGARDSKAQDFAGFQEEFSAICDDLVQTRPTAVNLDWAIERMREVVRKNRADSLENLKIFLEREAIKIFEQDQDINRKIGQYGKNLIRDGDSVLTHCNAGGLATSGYGTALGVIQAAHEEGKKVTVFADETRPVLQGARLTAWELKRSRIPVTLITDNMAGYVMREKKIDLVMVGADRIAANGDVVNKIGTYSVAVLAKAHRIPFYVAAPISTFDSSVARGDDVPIEKRDPREITHILGERIAPAGVLVLNPAFDVTPNEYVTAIITERGLIKSPYEKNLKFLNERD